MKYKIALIPGDGIGPELTETTMHVMNHARYERRAEKVWS